MLKRTAHIILSLWLAILLLFGGTPKEFLHLFAAHEDTVHAHLADDGLSFENKHHHCDFLKFSLSPFIQQATPFFEARHTDFFYQYAVSFSSLFKETLSEVISLRGPPADC